VVAGLDEVGRGALAGPVVAAAVVLPAGSGDLLASLAGVRDSKQLDAAARARLLPRIFETAASVAVGAAGPELIDAVGIARAGDIAMLRALAGLRQPADYLLVDGFRLRLSRLPQTAIVRGDQSVLSIAAASIVAKVHRDAWMIRLGFELPGYGFEQHKGYGSPTHLRALRAHGATIHHRLSWAPVEKARLGLGLCAGEWLQQACERRAPRQPALPGC